MIRTAFLHGAAALTLGALAPKPAPKPFVAGLPYDKTIELKMRALDGPDFDLIKYRGYVVWVNIFATWCGPCNSEQREVVAIAERYYDSGLRVIGMNDQESDDQVRGYRKKYGIRYPIAMDRDGFFASTLQTGKGDSSQLLPAQLLFTPQGYLAYYRPGVIDVENVASRIEGLLTLVDPSPSPGPYPTRTPSPAASPRSAETLDAARRRRRSTSLRR